MKTIRKKVFETNSSSSHSITINSIEAPSTKECQPLVEMNILYPERLSDYLQKYTFDESYLVCRTTDQKAAIVCNWIYVSANTSYVDRLFEIIKREIGYSDIIMDDYEFTPYTENDFEFDFSDYDSYESCASKLYKLISIIKNPHIEITDKVVPY